MYKISESQSLQVTRRVFDIDQQVVVFHTCVLPDEDRNYVMDYVELRDGSCRYLTLIDGELKPSSTVNSTGYTDAMAGFTDEPTDVEAESFLLALGALPPVWEEEES